MNCVVIYASRSGNTAKVAEAIAGGLRPRGSVQLLSVDEAPAVLSDGFDLLVVGGPTEAHGMTEPMTASSTNWRRARFKERPRPHSTRDCTGRIGCRAQQPPASPSD